MAFVRNHSGLRALKSALTKQIWRDNIKVVWLYGPTGRGKSHLLATIARTPGIEAYWKPTGQWFEGYNGELYLFMDDFRAGDMQFSDLLKLLDKFPVRVPIKGSSANLAAIYIFITTPQEPKITYNEHEDIEQLMRRIDYIISVQEWNVYDFKKGKTEDFIQDFEMCKDLLMPPEPAQMQDEEEESQAMQEQDEEEELPPAEQDEEEGSQAAPIEIDSD